jgi:hypothetical protein
MLAQCSGDLTIRDQRFNSTAEGYARYAAGTEEMASFLAAAAKPPGSGEP